MSTPVTDPAQTGQISTESRLRSELAHNYRFSDGEAIHDKYKIIRALGYGGFAEVYLCYDLTMEREVAVKVFNTADVELKEAKVAGKLDHPNIVGIHHADTLPDKTPYIVYKYIDGKTLESHLEEATYRRMNLNEETFAIITQIGQALHYAHSLGIVHRDVKPSNVLLDKSGKPYLTDFGLGEIKQMSEENSNKRSALSSMLESRMAGTVPYMAPEQLKAQSSGDQLTDLYSFGVVIYEMLTGQLPYHKGRETQLIVQIASDTTQPLPPNIANPELHEGVGRVIMRMLSKDPKQRHQSALDFVEDLTSVAQGYIAANTQYEKATKAMAQKNWRLALDIFTKMQKETPGHKDVFQQLERVQQKVRLLDLYEKATADVEQKKYQDALDKIELIQQIEPNYEVEGLRQQALHGRSEHEKRSLHEQYQQARTQFKANDYKAVLDTLAIIYEKNPAYPDPDQLQSKAQEKVDHQNHLRDLYNQGVESIRRQHWAEALAAFEQLSEIEPDYEDVGTRLTTVSHFHELSTLFQEAATALEEKSYATCFQKLNAVHYRNPNFKPTIIASKWAEALDELFRHTQQLLKQEQYEESLTAVALLREQEANYPGLDDLSLSAETGLANQQLRAHLDDLYGRAVEQLSQRQYSEVLQSWATIQAQKQTLDYPDTQSIAKQAKLSLYNEAIAALAQNDAAKALRLLAQLKKFDPDFIDDKQVAKQAEQKIAQSANLKRWGQRIGGGIILILLLLFGARACYNSVTGSAPDPTPTPTLTATVTPTVRATTPAPTQTALPPSPTATSTVPATHTPSPSPTPTATATQTPSVTPTPQLAATAVLPASILDKPETDAQELAFVAIGEQVTILGITPNGHWLWIRDQDGLEGFVAADRFNFTDTAVPTVIPSEISPTPQGQATALNAVTLYCDHRDSSKVIKDIRINTTVQVIGRSANSSWLYIQDPTGSQGFVSARFFDFPSNMIAALPVSQADPSCEGEETSSTPPTFSSVPQATAVAAAPLTLDIWPVGEATCQGGSWTQSLYMQGRGGNGLYTYYWNGQRKTGPTSSSSTFPLANNQGSLIGKARVESGDGQRYEIDFYINGVDCTNS